MRWYIEHSAKGTTWKKHKYIAIKDGRYIYPKKAKGSKASTPTVGGTGYGAAVDAIGPAIRRTKRAEKARKGVEEALKNVKIGKGSSKSKASKEYLKEKEYNSKKNKPASVKSEKEISAGSFVFDLKKEKKKKRR